MNATLTALMHGRRAGDIVVSALPCPHVYGNVVMNSAFLVGMTLVLHARFDEAAVLDSIARHRATLFEGVPAMYMFLLNHPALPGADLSSLRLCTVGGQTMPLPRMQEVERRFGCPLIELWGMTELAGLGTTFSHFGPVRHGSIGVPLPYLEARVVDVADPRRVLGPDQPGELQLRGPVVMQGYFGDEAATRETIDADGWLRTGDIARRDSDGFLYVVDRRKDMILTAGYNVYPAEIERVLAEHPAVAICAVGAIPDEVKGELPKAYVVLRAGVTASAEELVAFCRERLAAYKVPRAIAFVADLPRTSSGKVMRRRLAELDA
jgi:long-chain acyl-CoA synthetase